MVDKFYESLLRSDEQLAQTIRNEHDQWFTTIETALDRVIQGLNEFAEHKGQPTGELESARLFLATRTFRNLHTALRLVERGYWQQALGVIRMAMEDMLVTEDIEGNPAALNALFSKEGRFGRGELTYQKMAERISKRTGSAWATDYGDVSKYAAHPGMKALESIVTWNAAGKPHLSIASSYGKGQVAACVSMAAGVTLNLMATVFKLLRGTGSNWESQALPAFKAVDALCDELRKLATDESQEGA